MGNFMLAEWTACRIIDWKSFLGSVEHWNDFSHINLANFRKSWHRQQRVLAFFREIFSWILKVLGKHKIRAFFFSHIFLNAVKNIQKSHFHCTKIMGFRWRIFEFFSCILHSSFNCNFRGCFFSLSRICTLNKSFCLILYFELKNRKNEKKAKFPIYYNTCAATKKIKMYYWKIAPYDRCIIIQFIFDVEKTGWEWQKCVWSFSFTSLVSLRWFEPSYDGH